MDEETLDFYATPGRFTTLEDGDFSSGDVRAVVAVVPARMVRGARWQMVDAQLDATWRQMIGFTGDRHVAPIGVSVT
jgi:hypothetical protein